MYFSLLFKKGDPENLENWRPISLLNTDYKILAKALALRLQIVLPNIISLTSMNLSKTGLLVAIFDKYKI